MKLKPAFDDRIRLLFTDTDSLCVAIQSNDLMDEVKSLGLINEFDLADWPEDNSYYGKN